MKMIIKNCRFLSKKLCSLSRFRFLPRRSKSSLGSSINTNTNSTAVTVKTVGNCLENLKDSVTSEDAEPSYARSSKNMEEIVIHSARPYKCQHGGVLSDLNIAYESWGKLNHAKDNTILLCHGLSASSHAKSHKDKENSVKGWWENFIGPGLSLDTSKFHIICINILGSCYGTSGPSTIDTKTGRPYGSNFPIVTIEDMVRVMFYLLDILGIEKVHTVVGSSLGGMLSLMAAAVFQHRIDRLVSISAGANSPPSSIAYRYLQRVALMNDPKWKNGHYYDSEFPIDGTRLARKIATLTYRSGPEWEKRFKSEKKPDIIVPRYDGPEFLIEDYIRHQGESFLRKTKFDPNSLIYLSKAADIFDMSEGFSCMEEGFSRIKCPSLIMGSKSDILYPSTKQEEVVQYIVNGGNKDVILHIDEGYYGHDTFLLDVEGMGSKIKEFLES